MPIMPPWLQRIKGGFNNFATRLTGPADPNLNAQENAARQQQARMAMAAQILRSSGPRPQGTGNAFSDLGNAMTAGQQAAGQFSTDAIRAKLVQAQLAQSQAPNQRSSAAIGDMLALGYPLTKEGFAAYNKDRGSDNPAADQLAAIQAQLAIDQRRDQIERDRKADAEKSEEQERTRTQTGNAIKRSVSQTADIAGLVEGLEGSFLSAGMPASSWRRTAAATWAGLASAVGGDTSKLQAEIGKFDKLKKGLSDQLINLMSTGELGDATNAKLEQYQNALANTETSPPAIMSIQAGIAETLIEAADAQGFEIENRDEIEANIEKWRSYEASAPTSSSAPIESLLDKYAPVTR